MWGYRDDGDEFGLVWVRLGDLSVGSYLGACWMFKTSSNLVNLKILEV